MAAAMTTDLKKWGKFSAILEETGMRSSRKVVIGDGMDRQDNDSDRWKSWLGAQNSAKVGKRSQKSWILKSGIGIIFFNIVQFIPFIYRYIVGKSKSNTKIKLESSWVNLTKHIKNKKYIFNKLIKKIK